MLHIVSKSDLSIKDIVQISDFEINENINLNAKSVFSLSRLPLVERGDFVAYNDFLGVVSNLEMNKPSEVYKVHVEDINSLFDRKIILTNASLIASTGLEDFIATVIYNRFTNSTDTLLNIGYINVSTSTHTPYNFTVETNDGVYNFRTFLGNVKERYGVELDYTFVGSQLNIVIAKKTNTQFDFDATIQDIVMYDEVYSVDVIAKVTVFSKQSSVEVSYYLKTDRTVTNDVNDLNRAIGNIDVVVVENDADVAQGALDAFKSNSYNHNIRFALSKDNLVYSTSELFVGRPLRVKTYDNGIYFTFISKIQRKMKSNIIEYDCGNMKVTLIDRLKGTL